MGINDADLGLSLECMSDKRQRESEEREQGGRRNEAGRRSRAGDANGMPASAIFSFARVRRAAIVGVDTRKSRAICSVGVPSVCAAIGAVHV